MSNKFILAIETSCDETAVAVLREDENSLEVLSNRISSQVKLHAKWGGVVPNLAAREHVKSLPVVLAQALEEAQLTLADIDLISVVNGPGLIPALLAGLNFAKTLAYLTDKPLVGIHHIEGHIYANFISDKISEISNDQSASPAGGFPISQKATNYELRVTNLQNIEFPALCLVVSGGHTQLVLMKDHLQYEIVGQTLDDAVGEAFDKVARILDIGYPGGPHVAKLATKFQETRDEQQAISNNQYSITNDGFGYELPVTDYGISFPRPMINSGDLNFSFSGLKTAVLYETKKLKEKLPIADYESLIPQICHEFQKAAVEVLVSKTIKAAAQYNPKTILLAGGVSANRELRKKLGEAINSKLSAVSCQLPEISLTGDNAAMIGAAAHFRWQKMSDLEKNETRDNWKTLRADANLKLS